MAEEIIKEDNPEEEDTQKGKYMTFKSVCRVLRQFRR